MPRIKKCTVNIKLKKLKVYHGTCLDVGDREFDIIRIIVNKFEVISEFSG